LKSNRLLIIIVLVVALIGAGVTATYYLVGRGATTGSSSLPAGCVKPANGYLVIASDRGYNDSVDHGVPAKSWPIINVTQGQTVNITVCNTDFQAHGFQVTHYYDSNVVTIVPGQVLHVTFVADQKGEFRIYCNVFCSIHWAMQSGLLNVTAA
jgi:heme/copper-type cytochrome/quinol oxidase subunit 2